MPKSLFVGLLMLFSHNAQASAELEALYLALHITDWAQTRSFVRSNADHKQGFGTKMENNPFLPMKPSIEQVDRYFILTGGLHIWASQKIKDPFLLDLFQYGTIYMEALTIYKNNRIGINIKF